MPTKSNNMSPMPMQSKIGDASLKFGPDWLRALSSSENTGGPSTSPGGDGGPPPRGFGFSGWGPGPEGRSGFHSNSNKDHQHHNYSAAAAAFSSPPSFHPVSYHQSPRGGGETNKGTGIPSNPTRFKQSEHRYSREEMLALYDKNLESPEFLLTFGTLYIEKMQPPLAFSQPSEEEIRIWHIPQPESSRQGPGGAAPIGRGYATRGRGGGIDRGRGRGRGSYSTYGPRSHEEEDPRSSFSRPRNFERSQSNHERTAWGDRNGVVGSVGGPPGVAGPEESNRGGGSWRSRESFGGRRVSEEGTNDDGWRKPRWRRGDEAEDEYRSGSNSRRLHRSWSEEENHDNIPEWARDNPSEESGTFDSSGAFHGEDRNSKSSRETDNRKGGGENSGDSNSLLKSRGESEHLGSHSDRVQKRVQDRTESVKPVIPASVKEEAENNAGDEHDEYSSSLSNNRTSRDRDPFLTLSNSSHQQQQQQQQYHHHGSKNSIINIQKQLLESESHDRGGHLIGLSSSESHHIQRVQTVQHQMTASSHESRSQLLHAQSLVERAASGHGLHGGELRASSNTNESNMPSLNNEDDHYRSMTEEAMNLVSKLIEEDTLASRRLRGASGNNAMSQQQQQLLASLSAAETLSSSGGGGNKQQQQQSSHNDLSRPGPGGGGHHPSQNIPSQNTTTVHQPASSPSGSMEVWFYRDPQGSVQGPFTTHEMGLWCSQGYFSGSLQLRRECDKIFITLLEMGKVYGRNPFAVADSSPPPPPIQDPNASSALDHSSQLQAQLHQQRQQALLQQQNLMREQQQYMMNLNHGGGGAIRKEQQDPNWHQPQSSSIPPVVAPQQTRSTSNSSLSSEQIQAQLLMSMAKSQGLDRDQSAMDQLHALYQRQLKTAGNETLQSQNKNNFSDLMGNSQSTPTMDVASNNKSSSASVNDPIQSLVQQLTSMANTQHKISSTTSKPPDVISPWGQTGNSSVQQQQQTPQVQNQWGAAQPTQTPWEYREQMAKLQEEELRRRKEEEETERKRLEEEERKHLEDKQRIEHERKRLEEQQRMEEEKQRKIREEQYLLQKQQQEIMRKQQEEAEFQRLKDLQRQQLEQQRQLRDEQTRLAEEQQKLEEQRLEKERKEQVAAEREVKLRQERERELKLQQQAQFSWNTATVQPNASQNMAGGVAGSGGSKSLLEIQQEEAIKQEKEQASQKKKAQQEQLRQQQAQQQKAINLKWVANAGAVPTKQAPIKSLTEIQAEEQAKLQKQQDQEREKRAIINQQQQKQAVWSAQLTWADRALAGTGGSSSSGGGAKKVNGGVWDDSMASMASKLKGSNNPLPSSAPSSSSSSNNNNRGPAVGKKTKEISDDSFMKLFSVQQDGAATNQKGGSNRPKMTQQAADEFTRWCSDRIQAIASGSVDIPTFVSFLKEVESPYEVGDYVRSYLGDGKEAKEFSREFLERRSRWKNARKGDGLTSSMEDNLCRPASAINPNSNEFQEVKAKGKKTKKNKMQKVDSRILGFSTSTVTDRLSREYCDSTD